MNNICMHLREGAHFEVPLAYGIYWVPVSMLGGTRYTNEEIRDFIGDSPEIKRQRVDTLYEAVQLFVLSNFTESLDVIYHQENDHGWEFHKPGYYAVRDNTGCCSSDSAWLKYLLEGKYQEIGYFAYYRINQTGHVFNYIYSDGWYYLYDMCTVTQEHISTALKETGDKYDFYRAPYITGAMIKCKSLDDYSRYLRKVFLRSGQENFYLSYNTMEVPPTAIEKVNNTIYMYLPKDIKVILLNQTDKVQNYYKLEQIERPKFQVEW